MNNAITIDVRLDDSGIQANFDGLKKTIDDFATDAVAALGKITASMDTFISVSAQSTKSLASVENSTTSFSDSIQSALSSIDSFNKGFKNLNDANTNFLSVAKTANTLLSELRSASQNGEEGLKSLGKSLLTVKDAATAQSSTLQASSGALEGLKAASSEGADSVEKLNSTLENAGNSATKSTDGFGDMQSALGGMLTSLGLGLVLFVAFSDAGPGLTLVLGLVGAAFVLLGVSMQVGLGPIAWVAAGLTALIAIVAAVAKAFTQDALPEIERFGDSVSEATQQALEPIYELHDEGVFALRELAMTGTEVTDELANNVVSNFRRMREAAIDELTAQREQALDELRYLFQEEAEVYEDKLALLEEEEQAMQDNLASIEAACQLEAGEYQTLLDELALISDGKSELSEAEQQAVQDKVAQVRDALGDEADAYDEMLTDYEGFQAKRQEELYEGLTAEQKLYVDRKEEQEAFYDEEIASTEAKEDAIRQILKQASMDNRALTDEEYQELMELGYDFKDDMIEIMAESAEEKAALREEEAENATLLAAHQASEIAQSAIQQKDDTIRSAEEEYESVLAIAEQKREEGTAEAIAAADEMIAEAERTRDATILAAEETCESVVETAKIQAGEHAGVIDWQNGEIMSKHQLLQNAQKSIWSNIWDTITGKSRQSSEEMVENTENLTEGMTEAIEDGQDDFLEAFDENDKAAQDQMDENWEINSPSKVTKRLGESIGEGFIEGINQSEGPINSTFTNLFNGILGKLESFGNSYVKGWHSTVSQAARFASALPDGPRISVPSLSSVSVPRLARGAVIPPNREFLAVLGDQTSGRNLEAPEGLIRQIIREEMGGGAGGTDVNINFTGSLAQLARVLKPEIDKEAQRRGVRLVNA